MKVTSKTLLLGASSMIREMEQISEDWKVSPEYYISRRTELRHAIREINDYIDGIIREFEVARQGHVSKD